MEIFRVDFKEPRRAVGAVRKDFRVVWKSQMNYGQRSSNILHLSRKRTAADGPAHPHSASVESDGDCAIQVAQHCNELIIVVD